MSELPVTTLHYAPTLLSSTFLRTAYAWPGVPDF